jgi:8-oxo-dGTP diphosphatase
VSTILLMPHMAAGDRDAWVADQDLRPLSDLGRRQAAALAEMLERRDLSALYVSPTLRAQQTLQPLAAATGLPIVIDAGLAEKQEGEDTRALALRAWDTLRRIGEEAGEGTVAAVSHGDLIPAVAQFLADEYKLVMVPDLTRRGQWFEIETEGEDVWVTLSEGPAVFPHS